MEFCKYHVAGNDFIISDNMWLQEKRKNALAAAMCDRNFGVGANGFIMAEPSNTADIKMSFFNSDGSEVPACGNGLICFCKYVWDHRLVTRNPFMVEAGDGLKVAEISNKGRKVTSVRVVAESFSELTIKKIITESAEFSVIEVDLSVPEVVVVTDSDMRASTGSNGIDALNTLALVYGPVIESNEAFPNGTNVNFIMVMDKRHIICSTWERGVGKTLSSGTGASSSAIAAYSYLNCDRQSEVTMPGGKLVVTVTADKTIILEGETELICQGTFLDK